MHFRLHLFSFAGEYLCFRPIYSWLIDYASFHVISSGRPISIYDWYTDSLVHAFSMTIEGFKTMLLKKDLIVSDVNAVH